MYMLYRNSFYLGINCTDIQIPYNLQDYIAGTLYQMDTGQARLVKCTKIIVANDKCIFYINTTARSSNVPAGEFLTMKYASFYLI